MSPRPYLLNGRVVDRITAYLFHAGGNDDAAPLDANFGKCFVASYVCGMGFTFDDTDLKSVASPICEMQRLVRDDPRNGQRIFPFLGGEEINNSPTHIHHRYVINFENFPLSRHSEGKSWFLLSEDVQDRQVRLGTVAHDYPGPVAEDWPELVAIIRQRVKPERALQNRDAIRERWWQYAEKRPGLMRALKEVTSGIALASPSPHLAFARIPVGTIVSHPAAEGASDSFAVFASIQSRVHEVWARFMASSMKDDLRYTPSDCFETFPFPENYESSAALEAAGREYYEFRAELMIRHDEGLTKTYNRFHDPNEDSADIQRLRELHAAMDRSALDAYGWQDIQPVCEFFPEFDDEDEADEGGRPRKKKYRYRWPEEIHDDVLARLLELNRQHALEEGQILVPKQPTDGPWADPNKTPPKKDKRNTKAPDSTEPLFATTEEEA